MHNVHNFFLFFFAALVTNKVIIIIFLFTSTSVELKNKKQCTCYVRKSYCLPFNAICN